MLDNSATFNVLNISIAIVMGPTPPGTGVMALAIIAALLKSTSPVSFDFVSPFSSTSMRFIPTSITIAPSFMC